MAPLFSAPCLLETCVFKINLQCHEDCPQKIRKLLAKMGVKYVDMDIEKGLVTATAPKLDPHKIVEKIARCGKKAVVLSYDPTEATDQLPTDTDTSKPQTPAFPTQQKNQQRNCTATFPTNYAATSNQQGLAWNCPSQHQFWAAHSTQQHNLHDVQMQPALVNNGYNCNPIITEPVPPAYPSMVPRRQSSRFFSRRGYPADFVLKPVWPLSQLPAPLMPLQSMPPPPPPSHPANDYYYYHQPMQPAQLEHCQPSLLLRPPSYDYGQYHYDCQHHL